MAPTTNSPVRPLHRLSHHRILLAEERERRMAAHFQDRFGPEADAAIREARESHAAFLGPSRPEEALAGADSDPHDRLHRAARAQALREASVLAALVDLFGDSVEVEARLAAYDHGWEVGERVAGSRGLSGADPRTAFDLLADNFPWGTACDPGIRLLSCDEEEAVWEVFDQRALDLWAEAGVSAYLMCNLNAFWCKGFGEALRAEGGLSLDFRAGRSLADGDPHDEGRFKRPRTGSDTNAHFGSPTNQPSGTRFTEPK